MTLGTRAINQTIYVKQGSDWAVSLTIADADGNLVDLTGSSFSGQIRKSKGSVDVAASFVFTVDLGPNKITVSLGKAVSSAMETGDLETDDASRYVYDWEWTKANGTVDRFQEGVLILSKEVTR